MANVWDKAYYDRANMSRAKAHYVTRTKKDRGYLRFLGFLQKVLVLATAGVCLLIVLM